MSEAIYKKLARHLDELQRDGFPGGTPKRKAAWNCVF